MDIVVRGKNLPVPTELAAVSRRKVAKIARFTHDAGRVEVEFSEVRTARIADRQCCEITVHLSRRFLKAHASAAEPTAALDLAIDRLRYQVARLKERRVSRARGRHSNGSARGATGVGGSASRQDIDEDAAAPRIVKTKRLAVKPMDLEEAALQMELLGHAFFLFTNRETGRAALLYRRNDGDLGLIETVT